MVILKPLYTFMTMAFEEAEKAFYTDEVPVGAVVVFNNTIVGYGHNLTKTTCDPTAHAEILALRQAAQTLQTSYLSNCDIYVTLEPCAMCAGAIAHSRIRHLYFGAYDPKGGAIDHGPCLFHQPTIHHVPTITGGIFENRSRDLLKRFFQEKRKNNK